MDGQPCRLESKSKVLLTRAFLLHSPLSVPPPPQEGVMKGSFFKLPASPGSTGLMHPRFAPVNRPPSEVLDGPRDPQLLLQPEVGRLVPGLPHCRHGQLLLHGREQPPIRPPCHSPALPHSPGEPALVHAQLQEEPLCPPILPPPSALSPCSVVRMTITFRRAPTQGDVMAPGVRTGGIPAMHLADAFSCKQGGPEPTWAVMPLFLHSPVWGAAEGPRTVATTCGQKEEGRVGSLLGVLVPWQQGGQTWGQGGCRPS